MKKLLFLFNPRSGRGQIRSVLPDILDIMVKNGYRVEVRTTQSRGDAALVTELRAREFDLVVASGGDGTLDEVVSGMMRSPEKVPIGYIPAGSTNDFGSSIGIGQDMVKAAETAVTGKPFAFDIGRFNDSSFVYVAAFGIFTEVSYQTSQDLKNIFGHAAYILEGAKQLRDIPSYRMQVEYDGNVLYDEFIFGMVTNSNSVGGFKTLLPSDVKLNDGLFEVTLVRNPKNPLELSEILNCLTTGRRDSSMFCCFQTSGIRFTASEKVPWTLDGEYGGSPVTAVVRDENRALEIIVDAAEADSLSVQQEPAEKAD